MRKRRIKLLNNKYIIIIYFLILCTPYDVFAYPRLNTTAPEFYKHSKIRKWEALVRIGLLCHTGRNGRL
jgi:hypothetical protein